MQLYQALITLDGWTFLAQICNLMIQLVIFKKLLLNPVKKVIAERKAKADSQIADAEKLRTEAEAMKAEYEQNLQNARTEANQIVAAAQKTAAARSEELLGEARAQAAALKQKAEADIAQERKKAVNEVKDEIGGMAMEIASKVVETARMYGGSLYDLAAEEGLDERILGELDGVTALLNGDAEYLHLLSIPSIPKKERCALLDEAFRGQVHLYVLNFMKLLCEKGALRELPGCARAYRLRYNEAHGILEATAVSAVPLTAEQTRRLHEKLEKVTGRHIDLKTKVEPAVLGGIRLDIEGTELDGTVRSRLAGLRSSIAAATL